MVPREHSGKHPAASTNPIIESCAAWEQSYNFLWVIGHDALQRHVADVSCLHREWPRIKAMIERVAAKCDPNGLVRPPQNK